MKTSFILFISLIFIVIIVVFMNFNTTGTNITLSSKISDFLEGKFTDPNSENYLLYRLFIPKESKKNMKIPIVLYLHGGGNRGNDNKKQIEFGVKIFADMKSQDKHRCYILVPQCPLNKQWVNTSFKTTPFKNYNQKDIPESKEVKMIINLLKNLIAEYNIDHDRIYVTGCSMGGSGTWDIITRYPDFFAAAVPINGVSDTSLADRIRDLPIWAFHGKLDQISDVNNTRNMIKALKAQNPNCKYTEYKTSGHDISTKVYKDTSVMNWLFAQNKSKKL